MKKGFSLLELMVAVGILVLLFGLAFGMFNLSGLGWDTHNVQLKLQQEARRGMEAMVRELYLTNSSRITVDTINNIITFKVPVIIPTDESNPQDIYDPAGNIRWGAETNTTYSIRYSRNATRQLIREIINPSGGTISSRVSANDVQSLVFTPLPTVVQPQSLNINITCQKPLRLGSTTQLTATSESRVTFRN